MSIQTLTNAALIAFAVVFFVVGVLRVVEFKAAGIPKTQRKILIPLHVLGTLAFAGTFVLFALDPLGKQKMWMQGLFAAGLFILFPVHIYVGIKRRLRLTK